MLSGNAIREGVRTQYPASPPSPVVTSGAGAPGDPSPPRNEISHPQPNSTENPPPQGAKHPGSATEGGAKEICQENSAEKWSQKHVGSGGGPRLGQLAREVLTSRDRDDMAPLLMEADTNLWLH